MVIKAIIFDMDGVLVDARDWHYNALNKALELFGYTISRYDHLITFDGLPTKAKLQMLTLEQGFPQGLHDFVNKMKQEYTMETVFSKCKPTFNHQFALSKLKSEGYKLAVCSNSIKNTIQVMMEKSKLLNYLEFFISNQDVTLGKPHPEMYLNAIKNLNLKPEECLIVEDNENGVKAAIASGANLLKVNDVNDVNYYSIKKRIEELSLC